MELRWAGMRIGVIDLGTNSVRFDIHQIGPAGRIKELHREKLMIRLGQGVFTDGKLDKNAMRRALQAFISFQRTAAKLHSKKMVAFATSALREASDSSKLLSLIKARTGIEVRVISGEEEARLIAMGILANEEPPKGTFALVDIGGGSTEISICRNREILKCASFALGTARLQQVFLKGSPPRQPSKGKPGAIQQMRQYIKSVLLPKLIAEDWPEVDEIIGSSGTVKALGKIIRKTSGGKNLDRGELRKLVEQMSTMTTTQLLGVSGMEAKRVDMILAGAILLEECLDALGASKVITTDYSLRDGILNEQIQLYQKQDSSHLATHLPELYSKAARFGLKEAEIRQAVLTAEILFEKLKRVHKLRPQWSIYLTAATILRDTGEAIAPYQHPMHSHYVVTHSDLLSVEKWEAEFIGQLCLWHEGGKVDLKEVSFRHDKTKKQALLKLLSILRIVDALEGVRKPKEALRSVRVQRGEVKLILSERVTTDLEVLRVDQKKNLFEEVFGRALTTRRS
ncbi:MAG: Ppx/GppA phosphatase family protein [Bdellovibrionota bacterium]